MIPLIFSGILLFTGCGRATESADGASGPGIIKLDKCAIIHEPEFGGIYIKKTIEDFNDLGFEFGDSVTLEFSNGYSIESLPYFNGYYTKPGEALLVGYPGYDYIKAAISNGSDLWDIAELSDKDTAVITLEEKGKYIDIQNARDLHYSDDRDDYENDAVFANFRSVKCTGIREGMLYRSASPCDNQHGRAPYVDKLIREKGVVYILDLADDNDKINGYISSGDFDSPYFKELYDKGFVAPLSMNMDYTSDRFREGLKKGFTAIAEKEGPFLVQCTEGKDRTGYFCMLSEALCGASYEEIADDYMTTYQNYYHLDKKTDSDKIKIIIRDVLDPMITNTIGKGHTDIGNEDLSSCAEEYLLSIGLDADTISKVKDKLASAI